MKKLLIIAVMFIGFSQLQAQTKFGAQVNYATSTIAGLGFGAHAEFFLNEKLSIQPAFDYYLAKDVTTLGFTTPGFSSWAINADAHYYFTESGSMKIYGIGGLSYVNLTVGGGSIGGFAIPSVSSSTIGVNIGAGTTFGEGSTTPFAELKYNSPYAALVITAGVKFGGGK